MGGKKKEESNKGIRKVNVTYVFAAITCISIIFLFASSKLTVKSQQYIPPHLMPKKNPALAVKPVRKVRGYKINY